MAHRPAARCRDRAGGGRAGRLAASDARWCSKSQSHRNRGRSPRLERRPAPRRPRQSGPAIRLAEGHRPGRCRRPGSPGRRHLRLAGPPRPPGRRPGPCPSTRGRARPRWVAGDAGPAGRGGPHASRRRPRSGRPARRRARRSARSRRRSRRPAAPGRSSGRPGRRSGPRPGVLRRSPRRTAPRSKRRVRLEHWPGSARCPAGSGCTPGRRGRGEPRRPAGPARANRRRRAGRRSSRAPARKPSG